MQINVMNRTAFMAIMTLLLYFSLIMQCNFVITSLLGYYFINIIQSSTDDCGSGDHSEASLN